MYPLGYNVNPEETRWTLEEPEVSFWALSTVGGEKFYIHLRVYRDNYEKPIMPNGRSIQKCEFQRQSHFPSCNSKRIFSASTHLGG